MVGNKVISDEMIVSLCKMAWAVCKGKESEFNQAIFKLHKENPTRFITPIILKKKCIITLLIRKEEDYPRLIWHNYDFAI